MNQFAAFFSFILAHKIMVRLIIDGQLHSVKYGIFCNQEPKLFTGPQFLLLSL